MAFCKWTLQISRDDGRGIVLLSLVTPVLPATLRARWGLDANELEFVRSVKGTRSTKPDQNGPRVLLQMPADYYILALFAVTCDYLRPSAIIGLWHQCVMSAPRNERFPVGRRWMRQLFNRLDRSKWQSLYAALGLSYTRSLGVGPFTALRNRFLAHSIWKGLETKADLLVLELRGTHVGDLIYDTYLRYRVQPTVDLSDKFLRNLIAKALDSQSAMRRMLAEYKFDIYLTSYTSYIQHGLPAREALRGGLKVYSAGNLSQNFKCLDASDTLHTVAYWRYREAFEKLSEPDRARDEALKMLEKRFRGENDKATFYMKASAYGHTAETMPAGVEGVVFLHDFFDSPHCYRSMLFPDFLEWAHFTLGLIQKHGLAFAIKPHPNQLPESRHVVAKLQKQYPKVRWLSPSISNRSIFASGIKCGVSVHGTILHELAYHGIPAIAAGDHPHMAFRIAITPKTVDEYSNLLLNYSELKLDPGVQNEVLAFCYMHNLHENEGIALPLAAKWLREIEANNSTSLAKFMQRHPHFPKLNLPDDMGAA